MQIALGQVAAKMEISKYDLTMQQDMYYIVTLALKPGIVDDATYVR